MKIPFMDLKRQIEPLSAEFRGAFDRALQSTQFIGGEDVSRFESRFAEAHQCQHGIGVANGTDALILTLKALELGPEAQVIVPANSFIATSEAVTAAGAQVLFVDVDPKTFLWDENRVDDLLKKNPKIEALIPVHLYGQVCNLEQIRRWKDQYDLKVIEDAAQSHLGQYLGSPQKPISIGEISDAATFSFYPGKNLGAFGDAGAVITNDDSLAKKIRMLANHGRVEKYNHEFEGFNSRLDALQAAILNIKLPHLEGWSKKRHALAKRYESRLSGSSIQTPYLPEFPGHVLHLYVIRTSQREDLRDKLREHGISTGIHYPIALPNLAAYRNTVECDIPVANRLQDEILSLPLFAEMTFEEQDYVVEKILQEAP